MEEATTEVWGPGGDFHIGGASGITASAAGASSEVRGGGPGSRDLTRSHCRSMASAGVPYVAFLFSSRIFFTDAKATETGLRSAAQRGTGQWFVEGLMSRLGGLCQEGSKGSMSSQWGCGQREKLVCHLQVHVHQKSSDTVSDGDLGNPKNERV